MASRFSDHFETEFTGSIANNIRQTAEAMQIGKPNAGAVQIADVQRAFAIKFGFDLSDVKISAVDVDLVFHFPDGSKLVLPGLALSLLSADPPQISFNEARIEPAALFTQLGDVKLADHVLATSLTTGEPDKTSEGQGQSASETQHTPAQLRGLGGVGTTATTVTNATQAIESLPATKATLVALDHQIKNIPQASPGKSNPLSDIAGTIPEAPLLEAKVTVRLFGVTHASEIDTSRESPIVTNAFAAVPANTDPSLAAQSKRMDVFGTDRSDLINAADFSRVGLGKSMRHVELTAVAIGKEAVIGTLIRIAVPVGFEISGLQPLSMSGGRATYEFELTEKNTIGFDLVYSLPGADVQLGDKGYFGDLKTLIVELVIPNGTGTQTAYGKQFFAIAPRTDDGPLALTGDKGNQIAVLWSNPPDVLIGAGAGDDTIMASASADLIDGGNGNDLVSYAMSNAPVYASLVTGGKGGYAEGDRYTQVEGLEGSQYADRLTGDAGNNILIGGAGADTLDGAAGRDIADYSASKAGISVNLNRAIQTGGDAQGDVLSNFEDLRGSAFRDDLTGTAQANRLSGNAGNDTLKGGGGDDTLDGGDGVDTADFSDLGAADSLSVMLLGNTPSDAAVRRDGASETVSLVSIENIIAGRGHDALTGDESANNLVAGEGNDTVDGRGGNDSLDGGDGIDVVTYAHLRSGQDLTLSLVTGKAEVSASGGAIQKRDTLTGFENVIGGGGNDTIIGSALANDISGLDGQDSLDGGLGHDTLRGGRGDDTLIGGEGDDTLDGGEGHDSLIGGSGRDTLNGGAGNDVLDAGDGDDVIVVSAGDDTITGGDGIDVVDYSTLAPGSKILIARDHSGTLVVTVIDAFGQTVKQDRLTGVERIIGTDGNDLLAGDSAANSLVAGGGNDTLRGEGGDTLDGGAGTDIVDYSQLQLGQKLMVALDANGDAVARIVTNGVITASDALFGIENLTGSDGADDIAGNASANVLRGGAGNDTLKSLGGADTLDGGAGDDSFFIDGNVTIADSGGIDTILLTSAFGGQSYTLDADIERLDASAVLRGMTLLGNARANTIVGTAFSDTLAGGGGNDILQGGQGDDRYLIDSAGVITIEMSNEGHDSVELAQSYNATSYQLTANVETLDASRVLTGMALSGNELANRIIGTVGDDTINGGAGTDTFEGGAGDDRYIVENSATLVSENNAAGHDTIILSAGFAESAYSLASRAHIEDLSAANLTISIQLTGNSLANSLVGGAGDDTLDGGTGGDTLIGGAGDDVYLVDDMDDIVTEIAGEGHDTIRLQSSFAGSGYSTGLLNHVEVIDASNLTGALALTGNAIANLIIGGNGNDTLIGGAGNDTLDGGLGSFDVAQFEGAIGEYGFNVAIGNSLIVSDGTAARDGIDSVTDTELLSFNGVTYAAVVSPTGGSYSYSASAQPILFIGSSGHEAVNGSLASDYLVGNDGNDTLNGGAGNDTLIGGLGNDFYIVESAGDVLVELAGQGIDTIQLASSYAAGSFSLATRTAIENLDASALTTAITLTGNELANSIVGGSGADSIVAGAGYDTINGGAGSDTIDYSYTTSHLSIALNAAPTLTVTIVGGSDVDTITSIENITAGSGNDTLTGTSEANIFLGAGGDDSLFGEGGSDSISGGTGNDFIQGGTGDDTLDGGSGIDTLDYSYLIAAQSLNISLSDNGAVAAMISSTVAGGAETDSVAGFENVRGGAGHDVITGNSADNIITGNGGIDTLSGGAGDDRFIVTAGGQSIDGGAGVDTVDYSGAGQAVNVRLTPSSVNPAPIFSTNGATIVPGSTSNAQGLDFVLTESVSSSNTHHAAIFGVTNLGGPVSLSFWVARDVGLRNLFISYDTGIIANRWQEAVFDLATGATTTVAGAPALSMSSSVVNGTVGWTITFGVAATQTNTAAGVYFALYANTRLYWGDGVSALRVEDFKVSVAAPVPGGQDALKDVENLIGTTASDTLTGDERSNIIMGGLGNDTLSGGLGSDTLDYSYLSNNLTLTLSANGAEQTVVAVAGSDIDVVTGFENILSGSGHDSLVGNALDNLIRGGVGNDTLNGGAGDDTIDYSYLNTNLTLALAAAGAQQTVSAVAGSDVDQIQNFENILSGSGHDSITGNAANNLIRGGLGNDTLDGGAGVDTLDYTYSRSNLSITLNTDTSIAQTINAGSGDVDVVRNFENIFGGYGHDTIIGNAGDNVIRGGRGNDSLDGGDGNDTLDYSYVTEAVAATLAESGSWQTVTAASGDVDVIRNFENLRGGQTNDTLIGNSGDNLIDGGLGVDLMIGGAGNDIYIIDNVADYVIETINAGTDTVRFSSALSISSSWTLNNVEIVDASASAIGLTITAANAATIIGSAFNDGITGSADADSISAGLGNDNVIISRGQDTLDGGSISESNLLYAVGIASSITYDATTSVANVTFDAETFTQTIRNFSNFYLTAGADYFVGGSENNLVRSYGGNDTLDGGGGIDTFVGANGTNSLTLDLSAIDANGYATLTSGATMMIKSFEIIYGGTLSNWIRGSAANETFFGASANDTLSGGSGNDSLDGSAGIDTLDYSYLTTGLTLALATGGAQQTVTAVAGSDVDVILNFENVIGGSSADSITGNALDNVIRGGAGNDTIDGSTGNDTIDYFYTTNNLTIALAAAGSPTTVTVVAGSDVDTLFNIENVVGGSGNDTITGNAGNNVISGESGNDFISGNSGNDTIYGGAGVDTVQLANGNFVTYLPSYNAGDGSINFSGGAEVVTLYQVEKIKLGGNTAASLYVATNSSGSFAVSGSEWAYVLSTTANNTIDFSAVAAGRSIVNSWATIGYGYYNFNDGMTVYVRNFSSAIGTSGNDYFNADNGNNALSGGGGDDTFLGWQGNDTFDGGSGSDTANLSQAVTSGTLNGANDAIFTSWGSKTLRNIENIILGNSADNVTGDSNDNLFRGSGGNDTLDGADGRDTIDYSYLTSAQGLTLALSDNGAQQTVTAVAGTDVDVIRNFENVIGGAGADSITGNNLGNSIQGGAGNDTINGAAGNDTLDGGAGNDTLDYSYLTISDLTLTLGANGVQRTVTVGQGGETDTIQDFEHVIGGSGNDFITGNSLANSIVGGAGNDTIIGGGGNDTLDGGAGNNTLSYENPINAFGASPSFDSSSGWTLSATSSISSGVLNSNVSTFMFSGSGLQASTTYYFSFDYVRTSGLRLRMGNSPNDTGNIVWTSSSLGTSGTITGQFTTLSAAANPNFSFISFAADGTWFTGTIDNFQIAASGVTVNLATNTASGGDASNNVISNFTNVTGTVAPDTLTGDNNGNLLLGLAGNDAISGRGGDDTLDGGAGNDTLDYSYLTTDLMLTLVANSGQQAVTAVAGSDVDMIQNFESVVGGSGNDSITGNNLSNLISGGAGDDTLSGGSAGLDTLLGGLGNDQLILDVSQLANGSSVDGGAGTDIFRFATKASATSTNVTLGQLNTLLNSTETLDFTGTNNKINLAAIDLTSGSADRTSLAGIGGGAAVTVRYNASGANDQDTIGAVTGAGASDATGTAGTSGYTQNFYADAGKTQLLLTLIAA